MTRRVEAVGCWLWDNYDRPRLAAVGVTSVLVAVLGPAAGRTAIGVLLIAMALTLEFGRWVSIKRQSRPQSVLLPLALKSREVVECLAAQQGCTVPELVERSVALNRLDLVVDCARTRAVKALSDRDIARLTEVRPPRPRQRCGG